MKVQAPDVLEDLIHADKASIERLGHGNAIAQAYHHSILPLANSVETKKQRFYGVEQISSIALDESPRACGYLKQQWTPIP